MSRYGALICTDCRVRLHLGKALSASPDGEPIDRFHLGPAGAPPNSRQPELCGALWRLLAEHARHELRVLVEGDPRWEEAAGYAEIGGDAAGDVPLEQYLAGFCG